MKTYQYVAVGLILVAVAAGSFVATQAWQTPAPKQPAADEPAGSSKPCGEMECCRSLASWLGMSPEQTKEIRNIDATFPEDSTKLERALFDERQKLADLFDSPDATAEAIQQQVERVITANNALERRVADHLLALRPHLTAEQRAKLYRRCAQGIREAGGCRWRCAASAPTESQGCGRKRQ